MTQLGVTNVGMVPLVGFMDTDLLGLTSKNSANSYFNTPGSSPSQNSWHISQEEIAVAFPNSQGYKSSSGKTKFITDMRGIRGPEIGADDIKEIAESMAAAGYNKHIIEKSCNHILLRHARILGVTTGGMKYSADKSDACHVKALGFMIRGQAGYTNLEHTKHRVGDLLIADIPTRDELNAIDYRKAQMRGGVREGTIPIMLRKYKVRDQVQRAVSDLVMYLNSPDIFRQQLRSTNRADVAHMAAVHNITRFALYCAVRGYGLINGLTGLTSVPIAIFDPTRHLLLSGGDRAPALNRDTQGNQFNVEPSGSEPFAEIRRALYRRDTAKTMPKNGDNAQGIKRATESATIETILAVITGLIEGSPTVTSDTSNEFSGIVAAQLRADRRKADASATKDPLAGSFLEAAQGFTEALAQGLFYGADMKTTGKVRDSRLAFGSVHGNDGRFLRNLAMTTGGRSRIQRPNPNTEYGEVARLQQIMPAQGLSAMADIIDLERRNVVGVATRDQGHLGAGAVFLTQIP